jgi:hypothetical protein
MAKQALSIPRTVGADSPLASFQSPPEPETPPHESGGEPHGLPGNGDEIAAQRTSDANDPAPTPAPQRAKQSAGIPAGSTKFISARGPKAVALQLDAVLLELELAGFTADKGELIVALVHEHAKTDDKKIAALQRAITSYRREFPG